MVTSLFPGSDKGGSDHSGIGWGSGPHQEVRCVHNITTCINTDYCMASVCMAYTSELGCFTKWMPTNAWLQPGLPHSTQSDDNHGNRLTGPSCQNGCAVHDIKCIWFYSSSPQLQQWIAGGNLVYPFLLVWWAHPVLTPTQSDQEAAITYRVFENTSSLPPATSSKVVKSWLLSLKLDTNRDWWQYLLCNDHEKHTVVIIWISLWIGSNLNSPL